MQLQIGYARVSTTEQNLDLQLNALRKAGCSGNHIFTDKITGTKQEQLELFASRTHAVSEAVDRINNRWGEFVVTPALMMGMGDIILDRISFGGVKELREIYE